MASHWRTNRDLRHRPVAPLNNDNYPISDILNEELADTYVAEIRKKHKHRKKEGQHNDRVSTDTMEPHLRLSRRRRARLSGEEMDRRSARQKMARMEDPDAA